MTQIPLKIENEFGNLRTAIVQGASNLPAMDSLDEVAKHYDISYYDRERQYHPEDPGHYDVDRFREQLATFHKTLESNGVQLIHARDVPYAYVQCFTRDLGFAVGDTFFFGHSRHKVRDVEKRGFEHLKDSFADYVEIQNGHIEGGSVIVNGKTVFVGIDRQTYQGGFEELKSHLVRRGYECVPVPCEQSVLHLDCRFNIYSPEGAVLFTNGVKQEGIDNLKKHFNGKIDIMPDEERATLGSNFLMVSPKAAIVDPRNRRTNEILYKNGSGLIETRYDEVTKLWGAFRCSVMPLYRD